MLRFFGCQTQRFTFSNHFSNTSKSFEGNLINEIKNYKRILEVNRFMKLAQKKKVYLNNRKVM